VNRTRKSNTEGATGATATKPASPMKTEVKITSAKGRPMLTWVGKRPLSHITAFPAQHVETFDHGGAGLALPRAQQAAPLQDATIWQDWPSAYPKGGLLLHGHRNRPRRGDDSRSEVHQSCAGINAKEDSVVSSLRAKLRMSQ
jgi:hypothetical protein